MIFDEAHELEEVASSYFGLSVSNLRFEELARDTEVLLRGKEGTREDSGHRAAAARPGAHVFCRAAARAAMAASPSAIARSFLRPPAIFI